jgi:Flp pilus assembly protein TadD
MRGGRSGDAVEYLSRAQALKPFDAAIATDLGLVLRAAGDLEGAERALKAAVAAKPESSEALMVLGAIAMGQGRAFDAAAYFRWVVDVQPQSVPALINLGAALNVTGEFGEAEAVLTRAVMLQPTLADAHHNLGNANLGLARFDRARAAFKSAVILRPNDGRLIHYLGAMQLRLGEFAEGWMRYEQRFYEEGIGERTFKKRYPVPPAYWEGEELKGRRIVVWREQGLGDEIMAAGMLNDLLARGGECILICDGRMQQVHRRSFSGLRVERFGSVTDFKTLGCDFQIALGSLGRFFRRDFGSFPRHAGYLKADAGKVERLRRRYAGLAGGRRIVGVSWRSKNDKIGEAKSADLSDWAEVLGTPGVWFVNLQYGDCRGDLAAVKEKLGVEVYQDETIDTAGDLEDFFAQVAALDLVISTSNTTVHVAGSLNVPAWVLLPRGGGSLWYWFLERGDSPWYPSVKLYRQTGERRAGEAWWREVVPRVGSDLKAWAGHG